MTAFESYDFALLAIGVTAIASRNRDVWFMYAIVAMVWCAWSIVIMATGLYEPWGAGIVIDGAAAALLLRHPSTRSRAALGALYCLQIAMHIAFGVVQITRGPVAVDQYADWPGYIGWAQLAIVGAWASGSGGRRVIDRWRRRASSVRAAHISNHGAGR